jgi:hypothetical protein
MGPMNHWYETNNIPYTLKEVNSERFGKVQYKDYEIFHGGRIDCYCDNPEDIDYHPYNQELSLPIMKAESLYYLDKWLDTYKSENFNRNLLQTFEEETGYKLQYFKNINN